MTDERFSGDHAADDPNVDEPKLIIDEDWKTQVEREKEMLKKQKQQAAPSDESSDHSNSESVGVETPSDADKTESKSQSHAAPPATFEYLVSGMATQAVAAMGQLPDDDGNPFPVNLEYARHYIDLLGVLEAKTQGNLSDHEQKFLQDTLYQLRMLFVSVKQA